MSRKVPSKLASLIEPPRVALVARELRDQTELALPTFTALELAVVGAGSPISGLVASSEFLALDEISLVSGMVASLRGLAARGLVESSLPADQSGVKDSQDITLRLGGDLALVAAIRHQPALLAVVAVTASTDEETARAATASTRVVAILHGLAIDGVGLVGLLEETLAPDSVHRFVLCTPQRQAERLMNSLADLVSAPNAIPFRIEGSALALTVDIYMPDLRSPRHTKLALTGSALHDGAQDLISRRSSVEGPWEERRIARNGWSSMFEESVRLR